MTSRKRLSFIIISVTIIMLMLSSMSNRGSAAATEFKVEQVQYLVTESNENTITWFNSDYTQSYKYSVPLGSLINVTFLSVDSINPSLIIEIGNITRNNISDSEVEGNLALGYWKIPEFGLIANTSWNVLNASFHDAGFQDNVNYTMTFMTYEFTSDIVINAVKIWFSDGFQNTTLIYSVNEGILLKACTGFMGYLLGFELYAFSYNLFHESLVMMTVPVVSEVTTTVTVNQSITETTTVIETSIVSLSEQANSPVLPFVLGITWLGWLGILTWNKRKR